MREHIARLAFVSWIAMALFLAPSVGYLAIWEHNWTARGIMLFILCACWVSFVWAYREWALRNWRKSHAAALAR